MSALPRWCSDRAGKSLVEGCFHNNLGGTVTGISIDGIATGETSEGPSGQQGRHYRQRECAANHDLWLL